MRTIPELSREHIVDTCRVVLDRLRGSTLRKIHDSQGPVFYISDTYPGVWLEHTYDPVIWMKMTGDPIPAISHTKLFLAHQKPDGQLPCYFFNGKVGYSQLQENVSFAQLCWEVWEHTGDRAYLEQVYNSCCRWDAWLCKNRMGSHGLIRVYFGFDTGHDHSSRFRDLRYPGNMGDERNAAEYPQGCDVAPLIAPDVNAVFFGGRQALAKMAAELGLPEEAALWQEKAEQIRRKIYEYCWNEEDEFFYDVDKHGLQRKFTSIAITQLYHEGVLDQAHADRIFDRYFRDERHFNTYCPYPSMAASDSSFCKRISGNDWGYYVQTLTMLRCTRWMKQYGYEEEYRRNLAIWLHDLTAGTGNFTQELDPLTGEYAHCAEWFGPTLLFILAAALELGYIDRSFFA